jgi:hypothetical protein
VSRDAQARAELETRDLRSTRGLTQQLLTENEVLHALLVDAAMTLDEIAGMAARNRRLTPILERAADCLDRIRKGQPR